MLSCHGSVSQIYQMAIEAHESTRLVNQLNMLTASLQPCSGDCRETDKLSDNAIHQLIHQSTQFSLT